MPHLPRYMPSPEIALMAAAVVVALVGTIYRTVSIKGATYRRQISAVFVAVPIGLMLALAVTAQLGSVGLTTNSVAPQTASKSTVVLKATHIDSQIYGMNIPLYALQGIETSTPPNPVDTCRLAILDSVLPEESIFRITEAQAKTICGPKIWSDLQPCYAPGPIFDAAITGDTTRPDCA